jgi:lon-related putative ATP-dependent protease
MDVPEDSGQRAEKTGEPQARMSPGGELEPRTLRRRYDPGIIPFETTDEVSEVTEIVGQARAEASVQFGIGIERDGYNIFALGPPGTGKRALLRHYLTKQAASQPVPPDYCYIYNFEDPHKPQLLMLPAGTGATLRHDMQHLIEELRTVLASAFESEEYQARRKDIEDEFKEEPQKALQDIERRAKEAGLRLIRTPVGMAFAPVRDGEVLSGEEFQKLAADEQKTIESLVESFEEEVHRTLRQVPRWERLRGERVRELDEETAKLSIGHLLDELRAKFSELEQVREYLDTAQQDIISNARSIVKPEQPLPAMLAEAGGGTHGEPPTLTRYQVNVLVDNRDTKGAPVIAEDHPTYDNLVGRIEHVSRFGALSTDFTLIKSGALHRANGGFLVLEINKILRAPYAWDALKRALQSKNLRIEPLGQALSLVSTVTLEPEPVELDVTVILTGERLLYYLLCQYDPEFEELFKVAADFNDDMEASDDGTRRYVQLIATLVKKDGLRPFHRSALARLLEESARIASDQRKLTTHMRSLSDLLNEASYWAGVEGDEIVEASHVQRAVEAQIHRADRLRERVYEEITRGTIKIDTDGAAVGQVNGLSATALGNFMFGRPSRITARVRLGQGEVVDIEREVKLGGPVHSKGVLILSGYLGSRYVPDHPLSLSASLVFEQSYSGVEGDSASSAELFALLSGIADVPIKQSVAVTGSVNQRGEVQPVGAINEKIEGFFDICRARGLTGTQGVIMPAGNVEHLMLREDVVEAVEQDLFHIYAIETIDQGVELLTGLPAGERGENGEYPEGTFNHVVESHLLSLAEQRREFGVPGVEVTPVGAGEDVEEEGANGGNGGPPEPPAE